jgi:multiple sugar transport system permease protein
MSDTRVLPYLLIGPSVLFLLVLFLLPLGQTILLSLTSESGGLSLEAYQRMVGDLNFATAMRNTLALVVIVVPLQIALALGMGLMLQKMTAGRDVVLWIWTIPLGVSDLAAGLVWLAILSDAGYLNSALYGLGVIDGRTSWLSYETPLTLFIAVVLAEVWRATALVLVILVAGLQVIPKEYNEAAEVFGASPWTRFRRITLPLMKPSLQSALILRTVLAFEVFGVVYALGGKNLPVLVGEAYLWQNENQNYPVAAAYAVLIMVISLASTLLYLRLLRTPPEARS